MREYSIYIIRNTENEKVYIGQTCQSVVERLRNAEVEHFYAVGADVLVVIVEEKV